MHHGVLMGSSVKHAAFNLLRNPCLNSKVLLTTQAFGNWFARTVKTSRRDQVPITALEKAIKIQFGVVRESVGDDEGVVLPCQYDAGLPVLSEVALARKNGLKMPQGKYYLVDCGFPNRRKFLAPYRGVRYHLQDFAGHGNDPENEKELFNLRHASLRNVIERIFGIFKSRFTIFKSAPPFLFKTQAELVLACAALHNFLRKECRSEEFPVEPTDESSSSSSVLPNYEDNDHEPIVQTQEQEREDANIWRTNIGSDMWRNANN
ncbi:hypothetical protein D0Y65_034446 [Glycine soja]|uniref:DDE Tnp4 domain-containing protein n=1 Tax=Glycine soja TaxID=3848 RepID=A0A445HQJ2_GLYSO|nr:hypothetical protein D0Y65_034446 [Glycine soja]